MDDKLFKILKKVYFKKGYIKDEAGYLHEIDNGDNFDCLTKTTQYSITCLKPEENIYLVQSKYPINEVEHFTHDQCIERYKSLLQNGKLNLRNLLSAYLCGFHSFPRGRQPILSYLFAKSVPIHTYTVDNNNSPCPFCSIKTNNWIQKGENIFRWYYGYAWNECWENYIVDLEEFSQISACIPMEKDIQAFRSIIDCIRKAPADETPGKLEQRIRQAKIVPGYEKYRFRGQLSVLAELGIMPNSYVKPLYDGFTPFTERCEISTNVPGSCRSDIVLPLAGWRGTNAIDEERLYELFNDFM